MRELIYLSHRKLAMFAPSPRRRFLTRFRPRLDVNIPGVGNVGFDDQGDTQQSPDLDAVIASLHDSDRVLRWYEDGAAVAGDWIQFEAQMNWLVLDSDRFATTVLFVNCRSFDSDSDARLLLHGSSRHLFGHHKPPPVEDLRPQEVLVDSEGLEWYFQAVSEGLVSQMGTAFETVALDPTTTDPSAAAAENRFRGSSGLNISSSQLLGLYHSLECRFGAATAIWMGGLARVTASFENPYPETGFTVVATPLYVEFISAPSDEL